MTITPIFIYKNNYKPAIFRANNIENSDKLKSLAVLKTRLLKAQSMLNSCKKNQDEKSLIEYKIENLLLNIDYLQKSIKNDSRENQKQDMLHQLLMGNSDTVKLEKEAENLISLSYKNLGIEPLGRDLVIQTTKPYKFKPFEKSDKNLILDEYQQTAIDQFRQGNTVMVTAPTGTGKTLIAEHIIDDILKQGKKVIYTTPLKALCNDKYKQFSILWGDYDENGRLIGKSKVGLATGDAKINANAQLVVMTTEIYRNMLVQKNKSDAQEELKDVDAVILDEFHYMGDNSRGSVWEEALMFSPPEQKYLMLSATVSNVKTLNDWLNTIQNGHKSIVVNVPEEERHVPLKHFIYSKIGNNYGLYDLIDEKIDFNTLATKKLSKREKEALDEIGKIFNADNGIDALKKSFYMFSDAGKMSSRKFITNLVQNGIPYQKAEQFALRLADKKTQQINPLLMNLHSMDEIPTNYLIRELNRKKMLPALYFVYSKKNCQKLMKETSQTIGSLLTPDEKIKIQRKINNLQQKGVFLGADFEDTIKPCLLNGFAMHHSGMLPQCKSFIEELGRKKLVKVCFATDTLGAGINFPFKTVVFSEFEKYGDYGFEEISTNSFKQGAGRAGRRGIDDIGYVISIPMEKDDAIIPYEKIVKESDDINSAFRLSYGLVLSPRFLNHSSEILDKSFYAYQNKEITSESKTCDSMKKLLLERDFVSKNSDKLKLTKKGKIASKIRGINEILMTEILTNNEIMQNISPSELAGIISSFAPTKEENPQINKNLSEPYQRKLQKTIDIAQDIKNKEEELGIESNIKIDTSNVSAIKMWAEHSSETEDNSTLWTNIVNGSIVNNNISTEGDFLKKINFTTDVLKQIHKIAPTEYLQTTASKAIKMLQKSPVNDILLCELDYKENE